MLGRALNPPAKIALFAVFLTGACGLPIPFMGEKTEIDHCDPVANYFENGEHYIGADFVKEDGTIDYQKYFKARRTESSPCDPLNNAGDKQPVHQPGIGPSNKPGTDRPGEKRIAPPSANEPRDEPKPVAPNP